MKQTCADECPSAVSLACELKTALVDNGLQQGALSGNESIHISFILAAKGTVANQFQVLLGRFLVAQCSCSFCQPEVDLRDTHIGCIDS